jgi:CRP-like cAMP-binding protein
MAINDARAADDVSKLAATRLWVSAGLELADLDAIARACGNIRTVKSGTKLRGQNAPASEIHILLDGWAARYKIMADGARFISGLAVPGDICDLGALSFAKLNYGVTMISAGTIAVLPRQQFEALIGSNPAIANAFSSLARIESSIFMEWAASIARRPALHRVAHLLCELLLRLTAVGKINGHSYDLTVSQEQMADALGLTPPHVNRMFRLLRSMDLIFVQNRKVRIYDWLGLSDLCHFQPSYLNLDTIDEKFSRELPQTQIRTLVNFS